MVTKTGPRGQLRKVNDNFLISCKLFQIAEVLTLQDNSTYKSLKKKKNRAHDKSITNDLYRKVSLVLPQEQFMNFT